MKAPRPATNSQPPDKLKKTLSRRTGKAKQPNERKKVGRKPWVPDYAKIENWATAGLLDKEIAALSGITHQVFCTKKNELPELKTALDLGRAKGVAACSQKLLAMALSGDQQMLMFYLERVGGWSKTTRLERPNYKPIHEMTDDELLAIINGQQVI